MFRKLVAAFFILPTVLFVVQMALFPFPDLVDTGGGLAFASPDVKLRIAEEERRGLATLRSEIARQAQSVSYPEDGWQQPGIQSLFQMCLRRPDQTDGSAPASAEFTRQKNTRCQCLARAGLGAEDRTQMRYLVLTGLMIERMSVLRARLPAGDTVETEIGAAVGLDRAKAASLMERVKRRNAAC